MNELVKHREQPDFRTVVNFDNGIGALSATGYKYTVGVFGRWIEERGIDWRAVDNRTIVFYLEELKKAGRKAATLNGHLKALRRTFEAAVQEGQVASNPTDGLKYAKDTADRTARHKWLKTEQVKAIWRGLERKAGESGLRDRALFQVLAFTGCRASEVCNIRWSDLRFDGGKCTEIFISKAKGGKQRFVEFSEKQLKHLTAYRRHLEADGFALVDDYVFYSTPTAKYPTRHPLNRFTLYYAVRRWSKEIGVKSWCHMYRHSFASNVLRNGGDIVSLAERLGHSSPAITFDVYAHSDAEVLKSLPYDF